MNWNDWHSAKKILCVRLDSIGDILMSSPAFKCLKALDQKPQLTLLTSKQGSMIGKLLPEIDQTVIYDSPWMKSTDFHITPENDEKVIVWLRSQKFDGAIIFTVYSQNPFCAAYLCYMAKIPLRLAYARENPYQLLTHWVKEVEPDQLVRHEVKRQIHLIEPLLNHDQKKVSKSLKISDFVQDKIGALLDSYPNTTNRKRPLLIIHPGATATSRRYPIDKFARTINLLVKDAVFQLILTGSHEELEISSQILSYVPTPELVLSLVGRLNLEEFAALIQRASIVVSNNTSTVHFASVLDKPVIALYALTNPQHTPWTKRKRVLYREVSCKFCYRSVCPELHGLCIKGIEPHEIFNATNDLWQEIQMQSEAIQDEYQIVS